MSLALLWQHKGQIRSRGKLIRKLMTNGRENEERKKVDRHNATKHNKTKQKQKQTVYKNAYFHIHR